MSPAFPSKILLVHSGGIGDLLLTLPALRAFRKAFPASSAELMGFPERLSLVSCDLGAAALHSVDQAAMARFYLETGPLPPRLGHFFSSFSAALLVGGSQARTLAGNLVRAGLSRVIFLPSFPEEGKKRHVSEALLEGLESFGIAAEKGVVPLRLPPETLSFADALLAGSGWKTGVPILAIHPGSGSPGKNWSPENFARVADRAGERAHIFLITGPARDGAEDVLRALKKARPTVLDRLPLPRLAAVLGRCRVFLGNDSGITHLAAIMGVETFALFGPTDPAVWGPRGPRVRIITKDKSCVSCSSETRQVCGRPCLEEIEPSEVLKKMAPVLEAGAMAGGDD